MNANVIVPIEFDSHDGYTLGNTFLQHDASLKMTRENINYLKVYRLIGPICGCTPFCSLDCACQEACPWHAEEHVLSKVYENGYPILIKGKNSSGKPVYCRWISGSVMGEPYIRPFVDHSIFDEVTPGCWCSDGCPTYCLCDNPECDHFYRHTPTKKPDKTPQQFVYERTPEVYTCTPRKFTFDG